MVRATVVLKNRVDVPVTVWFCFLFFCFWEVKKNKLAASFGFQNWTGKILTKTIGVLKANIATQRNRRYTQIHVIHVVLDAPLHMVLQHLLNFFLDPDNCNGSQVQIVQ